MKKTGVSIPNLNRVPGVDVLDLFIPEGKENGGSFIAHMRFGDPLCSTISFGDDPALWCLGYDCHDNVDMFCIR